MSEINEIEGIETSKKFRILLTTDHLGEYGGAETYFFSLERLLKLNGHEVRIESDKPRIIHQFGCIFNPWYIVKFIYICYQFMPDIVHIHKYNHVHGFAPALAGRIFNAKIIITFQDFGLICPDGFDLRENGQICDKLFGVIISLILFFPHHQLSPSRILLRRL